jgi:WD40 repeat protein
MRFLQGHNGAVSVLAYAPGEPRLLASGGDDGTVRLWDVHAGRAIAVFRRHRKRVSSLAFSPDGKLLASGGEEDFVCVWDIAAGQRRCTLPTYPAVGPMVAAFAPNGTALVTGSAGHLHSRGDGAFAWWDVERRSVTCKGNWPEGIKHLAFAADGTLALAGRESGRVFLWSEDWERRPAWQFRAAVGGVAFAPMGGLRKKVLAVAAGRVVELRDVATRARLGLLRGHESDVLSLAFAADGRLLFTGGADATVRLWDVVAGEQCSAFDWEVGRVDAVAIAADGMTAAAAGQNGQIVIWDRDDSW